MCGIFGVFNWGDAALLSAAEGMGSALVHRGPDAGGWWHDERVALGNRRLSIIDLSPSAQQPMANEDGTVWVTYNGEIYNFAELREDLIRRGHRFRSRADTEVILHLYEAHGTGCVERLRGMFGFALWDRRNGRLLLARDRLGIKPLYYALAGRAVVFASEIKALLAAGIMPPRLDHRGVLEFLAFGSVPGPGTIVRGVQALPPGHYAVCRDGSVQVSRYWAPPFNVKRSIMEPEAASELRRLLAEAVRLHLISDVPLGLFLSGGIDSSGILAWMSEAGAGPIRTYNVTFPEAEYSEAPFARQVAEMFGAEHTEHEVTGADVAAAMDRIVSAMDQPSVDGVNTFFVSGIARAAGTTVALSGLGGDELFCGYPSFRRVPVAYRLVRALRALGPVRGLAGAAVRNGHGCGDGKIAYLAAEASTLADVYFALRALFPGVSLRRVVRPEIHPEPGETPRALRELGKNAEALSMIDAVSLMELGGYMHSQLLRDTDVMSMAHSLEVRVPLLDHRVVEFAASLPAAVKAGAPKRLLREALTGRLPPDILRRGKRGFVFPFDRWLRGPLRPLAEEALSPAAVDRVGLLRPEAVAELWQGFLNRPGTVHWSRVWAPVVLQLWVQTMMRSPSTPAPPRAACA